jgi:hypothetical protein
MYFDGFGSGGIPLVPQEGAIGPGGSCKLSAIPGSARCQGSCSEPKARGALAGWGLTAVDAHGRCSPSPDRFSTALDLHEAMNQIERLQRSLDEKQTEVEVLIEALDYARSLAA